MMTCCSLTSTARQTVAIVAAVNDGSVLSQNLLRSPWIKEKHVPVLVERGHPSASRAYNTALEKTDADIVVFAHQDVYLPEGWNERLGQSIENLERRGERWGVLGVTGMNEAGSLLGRVWSQGIGEIGEPVEYPMPVRSIDEIVIVLNRKSGITFDENMPVFHLYGTDIVQRALTLNLGAFVFNGPVVHNTVKLGQLGRDYSVAYRYIQARWPDALPIPTSVMTVSQSRWPLYQRRLRIAGRMLFGKRFGMPRHADPRQVAIEVGYERGAGTQGSSAFAKNEATCRNGPVSTPLA